MLVNCKTSRVSTGTAIASAWHAKLLPYLLLCGVIPKMLLARCWHTSCVYTGMLRLQKGISILHSFGALQSAFPILCANDTPHFLRNATKGYFEFHGVFLFTWALFAKSPIHLKQNHCSSKVYFYFDRLKSSNIIIYICIFFSLWYEPNFIEIAKSWSILILR